MHADDEEDNHDQDNDDHFDVVVNVSIKLTSSMRQTTAPITIDLTIANVPRLEARFDKN